jgi:uncharacterized membrane protein YfcA
VTAPPLSARSRALAVGIGVGAGILSGLFGVGGGFLIVPALTGLVGMGQRRANGTSLAAVIPISAAAAVGYAFDGYVNLFVAVLLVGGGIVGAEIGTRLLDRLPIRAIQFCFAALLVVAALRLVFGPVNKDAMHLGIATDVGLFALGVLTGILSGLLGVGGGFVMVPGMVLLASIPNSLAKGTSLVAIIPTAVFATRRNLRNGNADLRLGLLIGCVGGACSIVSARAFVGIDPRLSNILLGILLVILAATVARRASKPQTDAPAATAEARVDIV